MNNMTIEEEQAKLEAEKIAAEKLKLEEEKAGLETKLEMNTHIDVNADLTEVAKLKAEIEELKDKNTKTEKDNLLTKLESANINTKGFEKFDNKQLEAVSEVFGNEKGIAQLKAKDELKVVVKKPPKFDYDTGKWQHFNPDTGKHE